jgi:2Fe-2S ferredoxin
MMQATWELPDGQRITLEVAEGTNLMQAATAKGIRGIVGECGGAMACATCHIVVAPDWRAASGAPSVIEDDMLEIAETGKEDGSRLSCQIRMTAALDGIVVRIPG